MLIVKSPNSCSFTSFSILAKHTLCSMQPSITRCAFGPANSFVFDYLVRKLISLFPTVCFKDVILIVCVFVIFIISKNSVCVKALERIIWHGILRLGDQGMVH